LLPFATSSIGLSSLGSGGMSGGSSIVGVGGLLPLPATASLGGGSVLSGGSLSGTPSSVVPRDDSSLGLGSGVGRGSEGFGTGTSTPPSLARVSAPVSSITLQQQQQRQQQADMLGALAARLSGSAPTSGLISHTAGGSGSVGARDADLGGSGPRSGPLQSVAVATAAGTQAHVGAAVVGQCEGGAHSASAATAEDGASRGAETTGGGCDDDELDERLVACELAVGRTAVDAIMNSPVCTRNNGLAVTRSFLFCCSVFCFVLLTCWVSLETQLFAALLKQVCPAYEFRLGLH
jgi:hypothetical protein